MPHNSGYGSTRKTAESADFGIRDAVKRGMERVRSIKPIDIHEDVPHLRPGAPTREAGLRDAENMLNRRRDREKQALTAASENFAVNPMQTNPLRSGRLPADADRRAGLADDPRLGGPGGAAAQRTKLRSVGPINRRPDGRQTADSAVRGIVGRPDPVRREPSQADLLERAQRSGEDPLVMPLPPEQEEGPNPLNALFAVDDAEFDPLTVQRQAPPAPEFDPLTIPEQEGFDPIQVRPQQNLQRRTINTPRLLQIAMSKRRLGRGTARGDRFNVGGQEFSTFKPDQSVTGGGAALRERNRAGSGSGEPRSGITTGQAGKLIDPAQRRRMKEGQDPRGSIDQAPSSARGRGRGRFEGAGIPDAAAGRARPTPRSATSRDLAQSEGTPINARRSEIRAEALSKLAPPEQSAGPLSRSERTPRGPAIRSERNRVVDLGDRAEVISPPGAGGQRRSAAPSPAAQQRELSLAEPVAGRGRDRGILAKDVIRRAAQRRGLVSPKPQQVLARTPPRVAPPRTLAGRRPGIKRLLGIQGVRSSRGVRRFEDDTTQHQFTAGATA